jgi:hypothetical protein
MSLSVILSSIALLAVDSTEAMPHLWFDVSKRAAASDGNYRTNIIIKFYLNFIVQL